MTKKLVASQQFDPAVLETQVIEAIEGFLSGGLTGAEVSEFAIDEIRRDRLKARHALLAAALRALASSRHLQRSDAEPWLREIAAAFRGEADYVIKIRSYPLETR